MNNATCDNFNECMNFVNNKFVEAKIPLQIPQNFIVLTESFVEDVVATNFYVYQNLQNLLSELLSSWAPIFIPLCFCLCMAIAYTVRKYFTSIMALLSSEVIVMIALFAAPMTIPWKSQRFYIGLLFFASFLTIHSYVFDKIQKNSKSSKKNQQDVATRDNTENNNDKEIVDTEDNTWLSIYLETALFIRKQHSVSHADPKVSWKRLIYCFVVAFLADFATFLIKEFIPESIRYSNRYFFTSLIGGLWVLLAMDLSYCIANIFCDLVGKPIPFIYRHRHPFLSASISEFWGIRWNPIVGKLLQDSFYKPARRRGLSRPLCMIICFAGSALLHAYPLYVSTYSFLDAFMMGGFFVCQGFLILIEHGLFSVMGLSKYFDEHIMIKAGGAYTGAHFQWLVELSTVVAIVSTSYFIVDRHLTSMSSVEWIAFCAIPMISITGYTIFTAHNIAIADAHINNTRVFAQVVASKVMGWILTLTWVVLLLPLFCIPVLHAIETLHPKSYIAGPILRTIVKAMTDTNSV